MAEANNSFDMQRLRRLALEKCDGTITEDGVSELSGILASSDQACEAYWQIIAIHAQLQWDLGGKAAHQEGAAQLLIEAAESASPRATRASNRRSMTWLAGLAACLLIAALGGSLAWRHAQNQRRGEALVDRAEARVETAAVVGTLKSVAPQSRWSLGRPGGNNAGSLQQGDTIWLDEGAVELRLVSDTVALLESPLIMHVVSVDRVRVIRGAIKVEVAEGAEGFSVETASAEVIDLGTVFSVNVADGNTDVVVFDGQVDLKVAGNEAAGRPEGLTKRFRAGEAVHVSGDGTLSRIANVTSTNFSVVQQREPVIAAVKDNIARPDTWDFYEIVPGGMGEDQRAYVDRPHQWNGATPEGMPAYLVGGDYVKTFCNDKITKDLRIDVSLSRPAALFVLIDNRAVRPDWLVESFEPTGDDIGIDETGFDVWKQEPIGEDDLEAGPGNGIERKFAIWRKIVPEAGVVSLGPNGAPIRQTKSLDLNAAMAMYGIVAVPME